MAGSSYKGSEIKSVDQFISGDGLDSEREKEIGQHIGYRYDVNLVPDYERLTPFLKRYVELMGWDDLNWLEDVHMGYEEGKRGGVRPQHQRLGAGPGRHRPARQPAGPGHDRARAAHQVPRCRSATPWCSSGRRTRSSEAGVRSGGQWTETER